MAIISPYKFRQGRGKSGAGLTKMLNHFNGADEGSIPADEIVGISWIASNSILESAAPFVKFGTTGLHMDTGTAYAEGTGLSLSSASSWTAEVFAVGESTGKNAAAGPIRLLSNTDICMVFVVTPGPINTYLFQVRDSLGALIVDNTGAVTTTVAMQHLAVVYNGASYQAYVEGTRVVNAAVATNMRTPDRARLLSSGTLANGNGWDEIRISQTARYTGASLTVPTSEFTVD